MTVLSETRKKLNEKLLDRSSSIKQLKNERVELEQSETALNDLQEAHSIAQAVALAIQQQAHNQIAGVVSACLETVFHEPYVFKIKFEKKRGRTEALLVFERNGLEVDPLTASGGGAVDVASFALRLSCLLLSKPKLRRVLIMDEPFKFVSEEYRENVRVLLEQLSKEMSIQFIFVTHIQELVTGKVVKL